MKKWGKLEESPLIRVARLSGYINLCVQKAKPAKQQWVSLCFPASCLLAPAVLDGALCSKGHRQVLQGDGGWSGLTLEGKNPVVDQVEQNSDAALFNSVLWRETNLAGRIPAHQPGLESNIYGHWKAVNALQHPESYPSTATCTPGECRSRHEKDSFVVGVGLPHFSFSPGNFSFSFKPLF